MNKSRRALAASVRHPRASKSPKSSLSPEREPSDVALLSDTDAFETLNGLWKGKKGPLTRAAVIRNTNFTNNGQLDLSDVAELDVEDKQLASRMLKRHDIIVERSGGGPKQAVGRVCLFEAEGELPFSFSNFTSVIRVLAQDKLLPRYVHYYLLHLYKDGYTEGLQHATTGIRNLDFSSYLEAAVPLISKPEQRKIAAILWKLQRAIATQDRLIATTGDLKQSAMQRLFTHGLRGEPLKDTEIGPMPVSWKTINGSELFKLTSGALRPKELSPIPTLKKPHPVLGGNGVMGYAETYLVDEEKIIVIGRVGEYCGATHLTSGKVWITDNALYVKQWLHEDVDEEFVAQYLSHYDLNRFKRRAGQPLVTQGTINELSFAMPGPSEQRDIATALATIDRKLAHHRAKRAALDALFQTTLHQLMTGHARVADLDIDTSEVAP